jgi:hypothetical protein
MTYKIYALLDEKKAVRYVGFTSKHPAVAAKRIFLMAHCTQSSNYNLPVSVWARSVSPDNVSMKVLAEVSTKEEMRVTKKKLVRKHKKTVLNAYAYNFFFEG